MPAGRPPKPTALKLIEDRGKRGLNKTEPTAPPADAEDVPAYLDLGAAAFWHAYAPLLTGQGLLTELDIPEFATACELDSMYRRLWARINKYPYGKAAEKLTRRAKWAQEGRDRILAKFGFTPSDRSKISANPPSGDPFEKFLSGKKQA